MRRLSRANIWLVASVLSGCPLDIEVQSADPEGDAGTKDAASMDKSEDASGERNTEESGASCVEAVKRVCAQEKIDDESCVELILAKCDPKGSYGGGSGQGTSCAEPSHDDESCKLASEKCQYLDPEQCDELLAEVCSDGPREEPSDEDDCFQNVIEACDEWALSEIECDALLNAKCDVTSPEPEPDSSCFDKAFPRCMELKLTDVECKEWLVSVCEPPPPPPDSSDPVVDCIRAGKDPEACKNFAWK